MKDTNIFGKDRTGAFQSVRTDANGRLGMNYHFRDVTATGSATLTRAQEGTIIAGVASTWLDLIQVTLANTSTQAVSVQLRASTGGGVQDTITIPAGNTVSLEYLIPKQQDEQAAPWTAQMTGADQSDSPVTVGMTAIKNT